MKNATLVIHDTKKFENDIWQTGDGSFDKNAWLSIINNFAENAQAIYDWIEELKDYPYPSFDLYVLGDTINMLRSIDVERKVV